MHKSLAIIVFCCVPIFCQFCSPKKEKNTAVKNSPESTVIIEKSDLLIYGSMTCPHCVAFMTKLDAKGIPYTFYDVETSDEMWKEMYQKVQSINYQGYVSFPIVDARGKVFVNPALDEVLKSLNSPN